MRPRDIQAVLDSMAVIVDTREQDTMEARYRLREMRVQRAALDYGDYTYNAVLPSGAWIHDTAAGRIFPAIAIERKMHLDELAQCLTSSRKRFEAEIERAHAHGARLWLLIEDATWAALMDHQYRSMMSVNSYFGSLMALMTRYDVHMLMCGKWDSGQLIKRILTWELKERLERGDYG